MSKWENIQSIKNFREYLKIPSVHPNVDYEPCVAFLQRQADELGLPLKTYYCVPKKPIVIITWKGTEPSLPSIMLNSHMDVVPVFPDSWTYPPFDAHMADDGKIYARGSQDMKCVGMQYIEAIRRFIQKGIKLRRTIHLCFVPDEETGGVDGMHKFVDTQDFKNLNLGFALDEGIASPTEDYIVFNGERSIWHLHIKCPGNPGHGSLLLPNTAGEKVRIVVDKFMDYREKQKQRLAKDTSLTIGDVTTVNLTQLSGGVQTNVVPESLTVVFDIRLAVDVDHDDFLNMIRGWCDEAGEGIEFYFEQKNPKIEITPLDGTNPFWIAFKQTTDELKLNILKRIFPGGTDSRYIRGVGLPAIGFSPMMNTPVLLHDHDEYLEADVFLKGIDIYEKLIYAVANV